MLFQNNPIIFLALIPMVIIIPTVALLILFLFRYIKTHQRKLGY